MGSVRRVAPVLRGDANRATIRRSDPLKRTVGPRREHDFILLATGAATSRPGPRRSRPAVHRQCRLSFSFFLAKNPSLLLSGAQNRGTRARSANCTGGVTLTSIEPQRWLSLGGRREHQATAVG